MMEDLKCRNIYLRCLAVHSTLTCVPGVVTACPGECRLEGIEEVKEGPSQDNDVIHNSIQNKHLAAVA